MSSLFEKSIMDRELFSELAEPPITPTFMHMSVPLKDSDPYLLRINGEVLWQWRSYGLASPAKIFEVLQQNLGCLGYRLHNSVCHRIGTAISRKIFYLQNRVKTYKNRNSKALEKLRCDFWSVLTIYSEEIELRPTQVIYGLQQENLSLRQEIEEKSAKLYQCMSENVRTNKKFSEVSKRQQQRRLKDMRNRAEAGLWFAKTLGLLPKSLEVEDDSGATMTIPLHAKNQEDCTDACEDMQPQGENLAPEDDSYSRLSEDDKNRVRAVLYVLDRFSVSMRGYHELTQHAKQLPRTYIVESCMHTLNKEWDVTRTPGKTEGAELPLKYLLEREIRNYLSTHSNHSGKVKVKVSGDGARMSHSTNLFILTFSIIEESQACLSSAGNHAVAMVKTNEDYSNLKVGLANVIRDVNSLVDEGSILVDGQRVDVDVYLGGDYKFLLLANGMKAATSNNSCVWCTVHKNDRCDLSHESDFFIRPPMSRTRANWKQQPGCREDPLFAIPLEQVFPDELHLMLRVTDRLEEGIIMDALQWDDNDNQSRPASQRTNRHLNKLISCAKEHGVSLRVYQNGTKWEWTSLLGDEKRKLLSMLPNDFHHFLPSQKVEQTKKLWKDFEELCDLLRKDVLDDPQIADFEKKAMAWGRYMVGMSGSGPGYDHTIIITPYMHILVYHIPAMLRRLGSLRLFSGQGVEKKNDDVRRYFHRKINRWDACANLLLVEKRQEVLQDFKRSKGHYNKRNVYFWEGGGKLEVAKKVPRISKVPEEDPAAEEPAPPQFKKDELKKKKVPELLLLLTELTGQSVQARNTRKADIINELMTLTRSE